MPETALNRAYRRRLSSIRDRTTARVIAAQTADADAFVADVVPLVLDAQRRVVREADVYLSTEAGLATGTSTEPWGLDADELIGAKARNGDALEAVYARNLSAAESSFVKRMVREVATDISLADRSATYVHTAADTRVRAYRRTLSAGKNCGLCIAAATREYHKEDLRPIHLACKCGTQPVYGPAQAWTKPTNDMLRDLYAKAGGTDRSSLSRIRVDTPNLPDVDIITTNLGPTLTRAAAAA